MRTISKTILIALFAFCSLAAGGVQPNSDSLRFEVLLTSNMLNDIHLDESLINDIAITSSRLVLLSTTDQFYVMGWGGIVPLGKQVVGAISSYAYTPDSLLMTIRNNELCVFDSLGNLSKLFKLPSEGMGISAGKNVMYVYDRNKNQDRKAVYVIAKGGKYAKLFEVPAPIMSVVEMNNSILFATGNGLFSFDAKTSKMKALVALPQNVEIKSIALDISNQRIYFSTDSAVCAFIDSNVLLITDKLGGTLEYFNHGLMVFNPEKKLLIRIVGIENKIESAMKVAENGKHRSAVGSNAPSPFSMVDNHPFAIRPGESTWEQLNASVWLSGKSAEVAKEGDLEEASFLSDQAYQATLGGQLAVTVPSAPPVPASFDSPQNVQVYEGFTYAIYEQTRKAIEAIREVKEAAKKHEEADKRVAKNKKQIEMIRSKSPRASETAPDNLQMTTAQKVLGESKQELKDAEQREARAIQQKDQEVKRVIGLRSLYDKATSGAIDLNRFRHDKE